MSRVYTFLCPHCGRPDVNVWTRDGTRWYFCPHGHPRPVWNGDAWVSRECLASNAHVPAAIAGHLRSVYRLSSPKERRWYHGRTGDRQLGLAIDYGLAWFGPTHTLRGSASGQQGATLGP